MHPDDRGAGRAQALSEAMSTGRYGPLEHRIVRPDGELRWVAASGVARCATRRVRWCGVVGSVRTSRIVACSKRACSRRRSSRASGAWRAAWRTTSTTCSRRFWATSSSPRAHALARRSCGRCLDEIRVDRRAQRSAHGAAAGVRAASGDRAQGARRPTTLIKRLEPCAATRCSTSASTLTLRWRARGARARRREPARAGGAAT